MRTRARSIAILIASCFAALAGVQAAAQSAPKTAEQQFATTCAGCHGLDGKGAAKGPDIATLPKIAALSDAELERIIHDGVTGKGMPSMAVLGDARIDELVLYLRMLQRQARTAPAVNTNRATTATTIAPSTPALRFPATLTDGDRALLSSIDVQPSDIAQKALGANWTSYNGDYTGRRFSSLDEITPANAARLKPAWRVHTQNAGMMQATPVVVVGVMYVTRSNDAYALDARTGKLLWHHAREVGDGLVDDASGHINRGVAILGTRVYMETDNAHLLCLDARTGEQLWDVAYAAGNKNYGATSAPLIVKNKVLVGTSGGDDGVRGFLAAFDAQTGKELWRFWTIPGPGEKGSESWPGDLYLHGGGTTWMPGTYDPELNTLYWGTGNPAPDYDGSVRPGDDLYTSSLLALDPDTGRLKWHFQFSPHNLYDYDAAETPVLVDTAFHGVPRKLIVSANRNGFLYILDRITGEYLASKQFIPKLNWAKGIDAHGRPLSNNLIPDAAGVTVCPSVDGGTNWYSPTYDPATHTFYFRSLEACSLFQSAPDHFGEGETFYATGTGHATGSFADETHYLNAFSLDTFDFTWRDRLTGGGFAWAGVMSTAGGVVIFGNDLGELELDDASNGSRLWSAPLGTAMHASPMSYAIEGKQYIAVTAGDDVIAFSLP
ncbi:MAG TPA: PQQ-binding-like beta-propeller repeat protein [Acidobacteriaceae bacterium]